MYCMVLIFSHIFVLTSYIALTGIIKITRNENYSKH
jgi:hypothetical protein